MTLEVVLLASTPFMCLFVGLGLRLGLLAFDNLTTSAICFKGDFERIIGDFASLIATLTIGISLTTFVVSCNVSSTRGVGTEKDGNLPYKRLFKPVFVAEEEDEEEEEDEDMNPPRSPIPLFDL